MRSREPEAAFWFHPPKGRSGEWKKTEYRQNEIGVGVGARASPLAGRGEPSGPLIALADGEVDERRIHDDIVGGDAAGADLADPGSAYRAETSGEVPEHTPNKALYPTGAGRRMSAGG